MIATSNTVRLVSAAMAVFVGATLLLAKMHFSSEYARLTAASRGFVLPVVEVTGKPLATRLAATPSPSRPN